MIAPTAAAARPHRVSLQRPGPPVANGDGGYTQSWIDLAPPAVFAAIAPAAAADLERLGAGTVTATATHIVTMPFHPQVTTQARIVFNGRLFAVTGVMTPDERQADTIAICAEVVT